jgi:Domain of unknown function (DUF4340)
MSLDAVFADPRRRNLAVLGGVALLSLLLALAALWAADREGAEPTAPAEFLPGFAHEIRSAAHIHIQSKAGAFDVVFQPDKVWVVPQRHDYPANVQLVQRTLVGLAGLETIEPRTARADWLHYVGLDAPPRGDGMLITVSTDKGRLLGALIAGKTEDLGDSTGATAMFVRRPDETQSWLVRSVFEPRPSLSDWLDKTVVDVDRSRIQEVDADPAGSPSYVVARAKPSDPDFALMAPAGKKLPDPTAGDGVAAALTDFGFDDVRPAQELDFADAKTSSRLVTKTFDGLWVAVHVVRSGPDYWATVQAEAAPGTTAAAEQAAAINAHASRWAYKLSPFKGQLFMTTLDSLTRPPPAAPAQP